MGRSIFITGTDTGVGKTLITGLLGRFMLEKGMNAVTQKWVQTGSMGFSEDIALHMKLMRKTKEDFGGYFSEIAPYVLKFPSSPHLAARLENTKINVRRIENSFLKLRDNFDIVLVEGSGGLMVPLSDKLMIVDLVGKLKLSTLIVAENRLGAINQTVLAVEALRKRGIDILGIIFNQRSENEDGIILKDNPDIIQKFTGVEVLGQLPHSGNKEDLYEAFRPAAERLKI
jgi:dethiobiotin synthetase